MGQALDWAEVYGGCEYCDRHLRALAAAYRTAVEPPAVRRWNIQPAPFDGVDFMVSESGEWVKWADVAPHLRTAQPPEPAHTDDLAVDRFAAAMKAKLAKKRDEGRGGWDDPSRCSISYLQTLLHSHVYKGDMVDVGNFAMMLWNRFKSWDDEASSHPTKEGTPSTPAVEHVAAHDCACRECVDDEKECAHLPNQSAWCPKCTSAETSGDRNG